MLYIFHVDTGTMMTFDMNLAMENVSVLQSVISSMCHISEDKQVLLISGGESLDPTQRVAKYSAGTDTNPIFLFSKTTIEAATPPSPSIHYGSGTRSERPDIDLQGQVEGSLIMPPAYETVVSRTQLSVQFRDVDEEELKACERLVHDQHLQQQGWAAVVANLEDITSALRQRWELFQEAYDNYLTDRQGYLNTLASIGQSLELLTKIPLLTCLSTPLGLAMSYPHDPSNPIAADNMELAQCKTLFEWISSQDPQHSLHDMVEQCLKAAEQFDEKILDTLHSEVQQTMEAVDNCSMKEVKGLEDRLYGLDQFMSGARKIVQEQADMAKGFVQNQNRVSNLRDNSILPDLCASHKKQLVVMLNNHKKLRDIKKKCRMAKEELSINLHTRLRWVMFVEKKICDVDGKLMIYRENLKRLQKRLDILHQIHDAPRVYAELVVEVVRRRKFSTQFLEWAGNLALESSQLQTDEVNRRQAFLTELGKHFLQSLFQGFEDIPPVFATEAPEEFDQRLPPITDDDIKMLRDSVPELADRLSIPSSVAVGERMTLHTMMSSVSDSTVQCDAMVCRSLPGTIGSSTATSDITVIQSQGDHQFVHIENSNLSLKDQVAACGPHADIKIKPQIVIADRPNFPVPQSLSETLTQEMRAEVKAKEELAGKANVMKSAKGSQSVDGIKYVKMSDSADGLQSSGEPTKSSDSEVGSADRSRESLPGKKYHGKGHLTADTSPEVETSQEFTTADFYIDESMPSSMTDSPPNKHTSSGEKVTITQQLVEKTQSVAKLEKELVENQKKLTSSQKQIICLKEMITRDMPKLRELHSELRKTVLSDKESLNKHVDTSLKSTVTALTCFQDNVTKMHEEALNLLKAEHVKAVGVLENKIDEISKSKNESLKEVSTLQSKLQTAATDLEKLKLDYEKESKGMKEKFEEERDDLIRKHTLEQEVELDKVQSEYKIELDQYEGQVRELMDKLTEAEQNIKLSTAQIEKEVNQLNEKFDEEKAALRSSLEEEFRKREKEKIEEVRDETVKASDKKIEKLLLEHEKKLKQEMGKLCREKEQALLDQKDELENISKAYASDKIEKLNREKAAEIKQMQEQTEKGFNERLSALEKEHGEKVSGLKQAFSIERTELEQQLKQLERSAMSSTESQTEGQAVMALSQHEQQMEEAQMLLKEEMEKALREQKEVYEKEIEELAQKLDKEKDDSLSMKTSMTAERQVQFNEAVSRVGQEKDKMIDEVKQHLQEQTDKLESVSNEKLLVEKDLDEIRAKLEENDNQHRSKEAQLQDEMSLLQQKLSQLQQQILTKSEIAVTPPDVKEGASVVSIESKTSELESALKNKEEEISKLQERVMELSMTASTRTLAQDKVSITSCMVGDLVLLCLDERHDQYVVFTITTTLHFLHTECLDSLGLKTGPSETRKSWVLAEIVDKEYCQAKKPQNRFKVPVGTKFYRVKAKPWARETTRKDSASSSKTSQGGAAV
ncbi:RB1-inducible coiled-coil protein 1-like isoform X1 [Haliotis rufescens]|uniref:RB1-inducible coiled-coil protein 1-like isoform X1 n=1 Tax=Haliotis rufescens TaxID=6454 RepID=UPI00201ED941|nr:RB1-inducible coiled-coil protein 1-like isoform X1 [Haliotis rufescens]